VMSFPRRRTNRDESERIGVKPMVITNLAKQSNHARGA
jgi:hypothetical protein